MGETLRRRYGPLPVWAWALILIIALTLYLSYRKKKAAAAAAAAAAQSQATSSNLGTVPVSNLTTQAQPMPIQLGDTFVNTTVSPSNASPAPPGGPNPPSYSLQPAPPPAPSPAVTGTTANTGYGLVNTVQGIMAWLGVNTKGSPVYNVGGGAPVYFGNASALAQGTQYEQPGQDIYTPVGYEGQIAGTAVPINQPYGS